MSREKCRIDERIRDDIHARIKRARYDIRAEARGLAQTSMENRAGPRILSLLLPPPPPQPLHPAAAKGERRGLFISCNRQWSCHVNKESLRYARRDATTGAINHTCCGTRKETQGRDRTWRARAPHSIREIPRLATMLLHLLQTACLLGRQLISSDLKVPRGNVRGAQRNRSSRLAHSRRNPCY